jgi:hypothetical protein
MAMQEVMQTFQEVAFTKKHGIWGRNLSLINFPKPKKRVITQ